MIVPDDDAMRELGEAGDWIEPPMTTDIVCHVSAALSKPGQTARGFQLNIRWLDETYDGKQYQ